MSLCSMCIFVFFKQKTAYEMRISDWSSDVCSSDRKMHFGFMPAQAVPEWGAAGGEPLVAFGVSVMQGHGQSRSAAFAARADREYERMFDPGHIWVVDVASEDRRLDRKSTRLNSSH